jgi:hypothetical protein
MLTNLKNCTIDPSYRSDHSMIILSFVFNPFNKGKGLWKFNNSLLYEKDYRKIVRENIIDLKKQYAALIVYIFSIEFSVTFFSRRAISS